MDRKPKRHCWECRRRCLVCDSTEPACVRCSKSGIECPGYNDAKPVRLTWLAPGTVNARSRSRSRKGNSADEPERRANRHLMTATRRRLISEELACLPIPCFEMRTEACALPQAAEYYNACIYQDMAPVLQLGPMPHIYPVSSTHIHRAAIASPDYLQLAMVCMALGHRINQLGKGAETRPLVERFYEYWGLSARCLSRHLTIKENKMSNVVIAGIIMLMLTDIQHGSSPNWRCHLDGVCKVIAMRGGFRTLGDSAGTEPLITAVWFIGVLGNTTCPASDISMANFHLDVLDFLTDRHGDAPLYNMCPLPLFTEIVKGNQLRMQAATHDTTTREGLANEAYEILHRVHGFSAQLWAQQKRSCLSDWVLLGNVFQAAVALYSILSLQSLSVLPKTSGLRRLCESHGKDLQSHLSKAMLSSKTKRFMIWPLVLLGVEAVQHGPEMRNFVSKQLPDLSRDTGTYIPLEAKRVLEVFWDSGATSWDACFDRAYPFTMQIAVDTGRLAY